MPIRKRVKCLPLCPILLLSPPGHEDNNDNNRNTRYSCSHNLNWLHDMDDNTLYRVQKRVYYLPDSTDCGWHCYACGYQYGKNETLDRYFCVLKIDTILHSLCDCNFIHIPDATVEEKVLRHVEKRCLDTDQHNQLFILKECISYFSDQIKE